MANTAPGILLISPDLMLSSQLTGLAARVGGSLETLSRCDAAPRGGPYDLVLIDLGNLRESPEALLQQLATSLTQQPQPCLVAFGPHVHRERLEAAVTAGATEAVSRGELIGNFAECVGRWCGSNEG
ncbi:hypothetical protein EBU58_05585 [bacterium]|nr:hypothetical protein [Pirellulales bacterium]NBP80181.1 hypothetical protein [bacterium]